MHVTFSGAAREVTGSCHLLTVGEHTVVLDCGMFQGRRAESRAKNAVLPLPTERISSVVLSHAHIDHAGRLPFLTSRGYTGTIWATAATRDLCAVMLLDSAHIQEKDAEFLRKHGREPVELLYRTDDIAPMMKQMIGVPYEKTFDVVPGVRATFVDAGHILGSAAVILDCTEGSTTRRLVFSGDIGRWDQPIIRDPQPPGGADMVIMESTYGDRDHPPIEDMRERLAGIVNDTAAKGGRVLIPAFAVGRTQEIVYDLHHLTRKNRIPAIPIYIDSPLAVDATSVFGMHPEIFDRSEHLVQAVQDLFRFELVHYTRDVSESKALNAQRGPMVIISPSGMAEVGRILHHLKNGASDPRNTILIAGFQAEHTLGRRIVERQPVLRILGDDVPLRARVEVLNGYSAHADRAELTRWIDAVREKSRATPPVWLVHGEPASQDALSARLQSRGYEVHMPSPGDRAPL
ncbi:MAG TPA: MBL fold metallo-hydrolase [Gemmatimonadaceae bacterium]|nr:MBL fold metallo-hydrolase [Gemmatimonadaceae bacterium]